MKGTAFIIVLGLALLIAVGWLVFHASRILWGIVRYYLNERKPKREVQHPILGRLVAEQGLWSGRILQNSELIHFCIGGSDAAPSERLLGKLQTVLEAVEAFKSLAEGFLRSRETNLKPAKLSLYLLVFLNEQKPDDFTLEFVDQKDDSIVWRVEFENGQPSNIGFDD